MRLLSDLAPYPDLSGHGEYTARDYVQDGLVAMWDGKENAGWGVHDATAQTWVDLIRGLAFSVGGNSFISNGLSLGGANGIVTDIRPLGESPTSGHLEIVVSKTGNTATDIPIAGAWPQNLFVMSDYDGRQKYIQFANGNYGRVPVDSVKDVHSMSCSKSANLIPQNMYANAVEVFKDNSANGWVSTSTLCIGCGQTKTYYPFHGTIYSVRIYNRALTPAEVAHNYEVDKARFHIGEEPLAGKRLLGVGAKEAAPLKAEFPSGAGSRARGLLALRAINWRASGGEE